MVMDETPKLPQTEVATNTLREKIRQILPPHTFEVMLDWHWTTSAGIWHLNVTRSSVPHLVFKGRTLNWEGNDSMDNQLKDFIRVAIAVRALTPPINHS